MPARDLYHDAVRNVLTKDGWTITHDPYTLVFGPRHVFVDSGAERTLAAEKGDDKIAVEIKGFLGHSDIRDLENALGQYVFYRSLLVRSEPDRLLVMAIPDNVFHTTFTEPIAQPPIEDLKVRLVVFSSIEERIVRWMP